MIVEVSYFHQTGGGFQCRRSASQKETLLSAVVKVEDEQNTVAEKDKEKKLRSLNRDWKDDKSPGNGRIVLGVGVRRC